MHNIMHELYTTHMKDTGKMYWPIHLEAGPSDEMFFLVGKAGQKARVSTYGLAL